MLDLVIKNARRINNKKIEIGIKDGKIVNISKSITEKSKEIYELEDGDYISPGWIDAHVHCYEKMKLYYDFPDEIGVKKGVTTVIDAGTAGENNIKEFYELTKQNKTNVYALMNISENGIVEQNELSDLSKVNEGKNIERIKEFPDFIVGIKARMSKSVVGDNDTIPLKMAKKLQKKLNGIPLMVHIGSAPPELADILELLDSGDIVTHCYNGKLNGILDREGNIKDFVWEAYRKGIVFDIGHGTDSFNFTVGKKAIADGMICKTISTDIYHRNRENGPVYDLATTMEKALSIGIPLEQIINMITKNPAQIFRLKTKGSIELGFDADFTIFTVENKEKTLIDSNGNKERINKTIVPKVSIINGNIYKIK
ncbi:amidohydrolase/deacetylase family metallohydrolase [Miniphocaeibacter halophilus]|uniref:Amidohydrolase/deacetylase family metallohydrolase n=1 Tax=Miniphocaeibacter halophilus TaxID=2931922 RepID=A0AC61MS15_9FIRM|nr:amidohydrolase/deacetylase family metallohydrolase [Miniphocaeibacter halophilus]QQK08377.1 amidohydrolase/deacetylase family metallohydrolase [Miniphocaeibacter halophilus]